ncbi:MAG: hypothetical protein ACXIT4_03425 [Erythrobacter sp.]
MSPALASTGQNAPDEQRAPDQPAPEAPRERINIAVSVPRGEVNEARMRECVDEADAGTISGEIVVCGQFIDNPANRFSNSREEATKRYAQETAFKNAPPPPDTFGIANHGNPIGFGRPPPPALMIDVGALPAAPAGSDADRIARGLPPLGQDEELSEEQEKARREALGVAPPPQMIRPPSNPAKKKKR